MRGIRLALACILWAELALARENLDTERSLAEAMMSDAADARALAERESEGAVSSAPAGALRSDEDAAPERTWVILPQVGYSPERGPNGGLKIVDRDFGPFHGSVDFGAIYAAKGQQKYELSLLGPELLGGWVIALLEADFELDPTKEFFGLGNNDVGPDPLSTHESQVVNALATVGFRATPSLAFALSGGFSDTRIRHGELEDDRPSTVDLFSSLSGIEGGRTSPLAFSIVYNNREDPTRPTRGWNVVAKVQRVGRELDSDFEFTRMILDGSYLYPFLARRQIVGLRIGGEYIDAERRRVPFFELASLGGARDLRGYFHDRFLGKSRVMVNLEYRLKLVDFAVPNMWKVRLDGVAFGDMGRVFLADNELEDEFAADSDPLPKDFRYSYGSGVRIALGQALLARIDVGFSDEETALLYLTFGHTF